MGRITEIREAIGKFTEEMGHRPLRLRIREDIVDELANELESKFCMTDIDLTKKASERYNYFDGIPFITDDGFPHGIVQWRIEVVIDGELYYHAKIDSSPIPDGTITIDLKTSIMELIEWNL